MSSILDHSASLLGRDAYLHISVIVPTYSRPKMLARAISSIKKQTFRDFECIIVNDSPCDQAILNELIMSIRDPRFRLLHNEINMGGNYCRNRGINESSAPIIAFLDDDDEWRADKLEKHYQSHKESGRPVVVYSSLVLRWEDDERVDLYQPTRAVPPDTTGAIAAGSFCPATTTSVTVDRQCFINVGLFDELLPSLQDWDMWFRISQRYDFIAITEHLNTFHQHVGDRASINWEKRMQALDIIEEKYKGDTSVDFSRLRRRITNSAFISNVVNYAENIEYRNGLSFIFNNRKRLLRDVGFLSIITAFLRLFSPRDLVDCRRTFSGDSTKKELRKKTKNRRVNRNPQEL